MREQPSQIPPDDLDSQDEDLKLDTLPDDEEEFINLPHIATIAPSNNNLSDHTYPTLTPPHSTVTLPSIFSMVPSSFTNIIETSQDSSVLNADGQN